MRTCSSFRIVCRGCHAFARINSDPEDAIGRLVEFAREHASHFHMRTDANDMAVEPFGVVYGNTKE